MRRPPTEWGEVARGLKRTRSGYVLEKSRWIFHLSRHVPNRSSAAECSRMATTPGYAARGRKRDGTTSSQAISFCVCNIRPRADSFSPRKNQPASKMRAL
jgi:hypothetical protein